MNAVIYGRGMQFCSMITNSNADPNTQESRSRSYDATVIIQSYNRPKYLIEAIDSVRKQKTEYKVQLIVVKNYPDSEIDTVLDTEDTMNILSTDNTLVGKIKTGLEHSSGEIVLLLDDDDLFKEDKVQTVVNEFKNNSRLIYFHNFFDEIDGSGKIRDPILMRAARKDIVIDTSNFRKRHKKELFFFYSFYNNSSISIRRKQFMEVFQHYPEFHTTPSDMNIFFTSCATGLDVKFSKLKLNLYRIHSQNVTFSNDYDTKTQKYKRDAIRHFEEELNHKGEFIFPLLRARRLDTQFSLYFISGDSVKPTFTDLLYYFYYSFKRRNRFLLLMILLLYFGIVKRDRLVQLEEKRVKMRTTFD